MARRVQAEPPETAKPEPKSGGAKKSKAQKVKEWRARNPERYREKQREAQKRYRARKREKNSK